MPAKQKNEQDIPIIGQYTDLAREVRRLMGWNVEGAETVYTLRMAEARTGVSYGTISNLTKGFRSKVQNIIQFGENMPGSDIVKLVELAGYSIPTQKTGIVREGRAPYTAQTVTRELVRDTITAAAQSGELTQEEADEITAILARRRGNKRKAS